jgi:sortase A
VVSRVQPELTLGPAEYLAPPLEGAELDLPGDTHEERPESEAEMHRERTQLSGAPRPKLVVVVLAAVLALCVSVVFSVLFARVFSPLQEQRAQHQLYAEFRGLLDPSSVVAPKIGGPIPQGFPVALVDARQAGIHDLIVAQGTSSADLLSGPGHLSDTPLPGQKGDAVVLGKSTTAGAPFRDIGRLAKGDVIDVETGEGTFTFVVADTRRGDAKPPVLKAPSVLTLVTGDLSWSSGANPRAAGLIYVDATLKGKVKGTPAGQPRTVSATERPGNNDPNALPIVLAWLVVLFAVSAACWWLWARWGLTRTWIVGAPVLFALLWVISSEVMRFLPNVY